MPSVDVTKDRKNFLVQVLQRQVLATLEKSSSDCFGPLWTHTDTVGISPLLVVEERSRLSGIGGGAFSGA